MKNLKQTIMFIKTKTIFGQLLKTNLFKFLKKKTRNTFTFPSLNQININDWFDILENADYSKLNTTAEHFSKLYDEYFDAIDNKASKHFVNENFRKAKLAHKIDILVKCYETLNHIYNHGTRLSDPLELEKKLIETINVLHPRAKITGTIENKCKIIEQLILINTNEFKKIEIKEGKGGGSFISQVVAIELALNFKIDTLTTTVAKFIEYYKQAIKLQKNGASKK